MLLELENADLKKLEACLGSMDSSTEVYKITNAAISEIRNNIHKLAGQGSSFSVKVNITPNNCITINNLYGHTMLHALWKQIKVSSVINLYLIIYTCCLC